MRFPVKNSGLALFAAAVLCGAPLSASAQSFTIQIDFGDDSFGYVDGECDDPRFEGPGVFQGVGARGAEFGDATDCAAAVRAGRASLRSTAQARRSDLAQNQNQNQAPASQALAHTLDQTPAYAPGAPVPARPMSMDENLAEATRLFTTGNHQRALPFVRSLAHQRVASAQRMLADMYWNGQGVPRQDRTVARRWYERAVAQGDAEARRRMTEIESEAQTEARAEARREALNDAFYYHGAGDYQRALPLMRDLAEQGEAQAQRGLGEMYQNGQAVPVDLELARFWYQRAISGGDTLARERLSAMGGARR